MSALTESRNTLERQINFRRASAAATVYAGAMGAFKADGTVVPAADAAGLTVAGRIEHTAGNGDNIDVKVGCFLWENSETHALTSTHVNHICYVENDQTVSSDAGDHGVIAGVIVAVDDNGVWVDCRPAAIAAATGVTLPESDFDQMPLIAPTYVAPDGGSTADAEARAAIVQIAADNAALVAALKTAGLMASE